MSGTIDIVRQQTPAWEKYSQPAADGSLALGFSDPKHGSTAFEFFVKFKLIKSSTHSPSSEKPLHLFPAVDQHQSRAAARAKIAGHARPSSELQCRAALLRKRFLSFSHCAISPVYKGLDLLFDSAKRRVVSVVLINAAAVGSRGERFQCFRDTQRASYPLASNISSQILISSSTLTSSVRSSCLVTLARWNVWHWKKRGTF